MVVVYIIVMQLCKSPLSVTTCHSDNNVIVCMITTISNATMNQFQQIKWKLWFSFLTNNLWLCINFSILKWIRYILPPHVKLTRINEHDFRLVKVKYFLSMCFASSHTLTIISHVEICSVLLKYYIKYVWK